MNIMLATVTERTREIGVRRAMGAKQKDIIVQFLSETMVLSATGGCIGVFLGFRQTQRKSPTPPNMKMNKTRLALAGFLTTGLFLQAQDENEEVYELSPFSVDASKDTGYVATSTLAGTRINTPLRDIAASISVYTQEFIEDTGSTDITDLLVYAVGVEVDGMNGNFTD